MKKYLLCLALGIPMMSMASEPTDKSCEFLGEGAIQVASDLYRFDDGDVQTDSCEQGLFLYIDDNNQRSFIDKFGKTIIKANPDMNFTSSFHQGVAIAASADGKEGLVNTKAEWVLKPKYSTIFDFENGLAIVNGGTIDEFYFGVIDVTGREVIPVSKGSVSKAQIGDADTKYLRSIFDNRGDVLKMAIYDKYGKTIIPMAEQNISVDASNSMGMLCRKDFGCVFLDKNYNQLSQIIYDEDTPSLAFDFISDGDAIIVKRNGRYGYVDSNGKEIIKAEYDFVDKFDLGVAVVQSNERFYLINRSNQRIAPTYQELSRGADGVDFFIAKQNGKYGAITRANNIIIPFAYDDLKFVWSGGFDAEKMDFYFVDGVVAYRMNDLWGLMDVDGKIISEPQYQVVHNYQDGVIAVKKNGKWGFVDKSNNVILDFIYDDPKRELKSHEYTAQDDRIIVMRDGKWGVIDILGRTIVDFNFDEILEPISLYHYPAIKNGKNVSIYIDEQHGVYLVDNDMSDMP